LVPHCDALLLDGDVYANWSERPISAISWLDGQAEITPKDPKRWADELGRALAIVHAVPRDRPAALPSVFDRSDGAQEALDGPFVRCVRSHWSRIIGSPEVLVHCDYWPGNVVWRDGRLVGIAD
jgi:Ser/Thr protein kinase RdoA (MazF antagonist)